MNRDQLILVVLFQYGLLEQFDLIAGSYRMISSGHLLEYKR